MGLGEAEVRERLDLRVDPVGGLVDEPAAGHPGVQLVPDLLDLLQTPLRPHRPAQQVGLVGRAVADGRGHLDELLLEDGDAECPLEDVLEVAVRVGDGELLRGLAPGLPLPVHLVHLVLRHLPTDERVHGAALDGSGADESDLDGEVVEASRLQPGEQPDLRAGLHLEDADRVGPAEHVVDAGLLLRQGLQRPLLARRLPDQVEAVLQRREHAQTEEVELHQSHEGGVVLVPLDDGAVLHAGVLDRHHLTDRPGCEHHAARVDPQMPWSLQQLGRVVEHGVGDVVALDGFEPRSPAVHLPRPGVLLSRRVPQGSGHITDRILRPVLDDVRHLSRPLPAVLPVDPLDDLLPSP